MRILFIIFPLSLMISCIQKEEIEQNQIKLTFYNQSNEKVSKISLYFKEFNYEYPIYYLNSDTIILSNVIQAGQSTTFKFNKKNLYSNWSVGKAQYLVYEIQKGNDEILDSIKYVYGFDKEVIIK